MRIGDRRHAGAMRAAGSRYWQLCNASITKPLLMPRLHLRRYGHDRFVNSARPARRRSQVFVVFPDLRLLDQPGVCSLISIPHKT